MQRKGDALEQKLAKYLGASRRQGRAGGAAIRKLSDESAPTSRLETLRKYPKLIEFYSSCTAEIENDGHRFGEDLSEADKKALIAFLATL